jgi:hypothetical protein
MPTGTNWSQDCTTLASARALTTHGLARAARDRGLRAHLQESGTGTPILAALFGCGAFFCESPLGRGH